LIYNNPLFQFIDNGLFVFYIYRLSSQIITIQGVLTTEYVILEWRPDLIQELLYYLRPENLRFTVVSKTFEDQTDSVDKYCETLYTISKIPTEILNEWQINNLDMRRFKNAIE
jgi:hypothetical protein